MDQKAILKKLREVGAYQDAGHFIYTSGMHGSVYINKDAIYPHTELISAMCRQIAEHFADGGIEVVIGPAVGGVVLSQWVAHHLSEITDREVLAAYADKRASGGFIVRRGYEKLIRDRKVLLVDDIINQGVSVRAMISAIKDRGGEVEQVACLVNRGGKKAAEFEVSEIYALLNIKLDIYAAADCQLCAHKMPINTNLGKGK